MSHKKQHIVSETYLKFFSKENKGKGIKTLHLNNPYKKKIETHNTGDSLFWTKNFYNSTEFKNPKTVELFLGQKKCRFKTIFPILNTLIVNKGCCTEIHRAYSEYHREINN